MSQRNPMNERYTSEERPGKTRKSAASAKPATKAASSVRVQGQKSDKPKGLFAKARTEANKSEAKSKSNAKSSQSKATTVYNVPTDEYRKWRRLWMATLVAAITFTVLSFAAMNMPQFAESQLAMVTLGMGYVFLAAAIIIDIAKVRKIRQAYNETVVNNRSKEATKSRKEQKAAAREQEALRREEAERKAAERVEKNAALSSKFGKLLGRGGSGAAASSAAAGNDAEDAQGDGSDAKGSSDSSNK